MKFIATRAIEFFKKHFGVWCKRDVGTMYFDMVNIIREEGFPFTDDELRKYWPQHYDYWDKLEKLKTVLADVWTAGYTNMSFIGFPNDMTVITKDKVNVMVKEMFGDEAVKVVEGLMELNIRTTVLCLSDDRGYIELKKMDDEVLVYLHGTECPDHIILLHEDFSKEDVENYRKELYGNKNGNS